jgi:hypothetical protein
MSEMDPLSVAASCLTVVALPIQVAEGAKRLYNFWRNVKDAPDEVKTLVSELGILSEVLDKLQRRYQNPLAATSPLFSCNNFIQKLTTITRRLEPGFESGSQRARTWASVKTALKRRDIESILGSLRDAKVTLILAQQTHDQ